MAIFPGGIATDGDLYIAVNQKSTLLTDNPLTIGATTVNVISTLGFPNIGTISIGAEIIRYTNATATQFTGCTRGFDGTTAAAHALNDQVDHNVVAAHHNANKDEIIAVETFISTHIGLTTAVTAAEFERLSGVTSSIQTQLNGKADDTLVVHLAGTETITGAKTYANATWLHSLANSGANVLLRLRNTSNTADSTARLDIVVGGSSAGDPFIFFDDGGAETWALGLRNADGNKFKIASGNTGLNAGVKVTITQAGQFAIGTENPELYNANTDNLVVANSAGVVGMTLRSATNSSCIIGFQDAENTTVVGLIQYDNAASAANEVMHFRVGGIDDVLLLTGGSQIQGLNGTAALPTFSWSGDPDNGLYLRLANSPGMSAAGIAVMDWNSTIIRSHVNFQLTSGVIEVPNGTVAAPSYRFAGNAGSGFFYSGSVTGESQWTANGQVAIRVHPSNLAFYTQNVERWNISSAGNLIPVTDNAYSLGQSGARTSSVWSANGTIQTSMSTTKENVAELWPEEPIECKVPMPVIFNRPGEEIDQRRLGWLADSLPAEAHPVIGRDEEGNVIRSTDDVYTDSILAMHSLALRNDYERLAAKDTEVAALQATIVALEARIAALEVE